MQNPSHKQTIAILEPFVSDHKQALIDRVLAKRTRHTTLVFEDIDKPHNVSAVVRTAECMGIQDLHFIKNKNPFTVNKKIAKGAARWVTMHHYTDQKNNLEACYNHLRSDGYRIYATSLNEKSRTIYDLDPKEKTAIVFGTELEGISKEAGKKADGCVHIPMVGFTESFNLSVSASITLMALKNGKSHWPPLCEEEKVELRAVWYRKIVREAEKILIHQTS